jgi:tetratricopeptide (TPR) repeat protein
MALLTGRPTLEGVLLQTAVNSPTIYWLQSQISKQGTGVIPGYPYPRFDPGRSAPRLALFNAHDLIAVTDELREALDRDPRWERTVSEPPYAVFHLKDIDPHYVRVPRYEPVLLETDAWKRAFHRWFATDSVLDVPLVAAHSVPPAEHGRFASSSASPTELARRPIEARCRIDERIDHLEIRFTTSCPGLPHWIAVSYFPNWKAEGASGPFLASPGFMLVFPEGPEVRLSFRRIAVDWLGLGLSGAGLGLCLVRRREPGFQSEPSGAVARALTAAHPWLLGIGVFGVCAVTVWHAARDLGPSYFFARGWLAFEAEDYAASQRSFERARWLGGDSETAANASFFRAASLLRAGDPAAALEGYEEVIAEFPDSSWVSESHYHVGLCLRQLGRPGEARERFEFVVSSYPGDRWAGFAAEQIEQLGPSAGPMPVPPDSPPTSAP